VTNKKYLPAHICTEFISCKYYFCINTNLSLQLNFQGLINAVQKIWPDAEHRFCVRHLYQNFQKAGHKGEVLKNDLWAIARSTNVAKWQQNLDKMQVDSVEAYEWVQNLVPNTWIKAFFNEFPKCDLLLNNHCEVYNR
jgi:transposase-like protein